MQILFQASYPNIYSLLTGVTFEVLPLSSYAFTPMMLPLLETFLELVIWNSFQYRSYIFILDIFIVLKTLILERVIIHLEKNQRNLLGVDFWARNYLTERAL